MRLLDLILNEKLDMVDLCLASGKNQRSFSVDVACVYLHLLFISDPFFS